MEKTPPDILSFWQAFIDTLPHDAFYRSIDVPSAWGFGTGAQMADELGALVLQGIKTATCGLLWEYEAENEALPQPGDINIILNGSGQPLCIIEILAVEIMPFDAVGADFAFDEGEGDRSLDYWRAAHLRFFSRTCRQIGRDVRPDMPLVCERFRIIYPLEEQASNPQQGCF